MQNALVAKSAALSEERLTRSLVQSCPAAVQKNLQQVLEKMLQRRGADDSILRRIAVPGAEVQGAAAESLRTFQQHFEDKAKSAGASSMSSSPPPMPPGFQAVVDSIARRTGDARSAIAMLSKNLATAAGSDSASAWQSVMLLQAMCVSDDLKPPQLANLKHTVGNSPSLIQAPLATAIAAI